MLDEHYHPNSIVSGALYLNVDDSCYLTFHNPNPYIYFTDIVEYNSCNYQWQKYYVKNGDLILFPSWLRHSVPSNPTEKRYTISFNTIRRDDREHYQTLRDYRTDPHESSNT